MILKNTLYNLNGDVTLQYHYEFLDKNIYKATIVKNNNTNTDLKWYTVYYLDTSKFKKYLTTDNSLISEGVIRNGYWKIDQILNKYTFLNHSHYLGLESLKVQETSIGTVANNHTICMVSDKLLSDYISEEYYDNLPISSVKLTGQKWEGYSFVGRKTYHGFLTAVTSELTF